ncbi:hypothetical protein IW245_000498 [Longispora fulva]|uniref:Uncharacterized protein n=1 Tax=Longispora fulva TaxID=619741 RepID=A0A8J7G9R7_9ACTN|nr:hypothetical protein [Longispora fulva]
MHTATPLAVDTAVAAVRVTTPTDRNRPATIGAARTLSGVRK